MLNKVVFLAMMLIWIAPASFAFSNCQLKYDNDKRALPSLKGKCSVCHINPSGSGPVNAFGKAFADNGFKITDDLVTKFPDLFQQPKEEPKVTPAPTSSPQTTPIPQAGIESPKSGAPSIKRVRPKKVKVNIQSMITIIGKNFVNESKAFIDNNEVLTTFKSNVRLLINFVLNSVGIHELKVKNPDGEESNTVKIKAK